LSTGPRVPVKALCIGINYIGTDAQLGGCVNDANNIKNFLIANGDYPPDSIVTLLDAAATRSTIVEKMKWLVNDAKPGDRRFLHYSGHGSNMMDKAESGVPLDENDGKDECICPVDYKTAGFIKDDEIRQIINVIPEGCKLTCIFDSCNSGTICDLRYNYTKMSGNEIIYRSETQYPETAGTIVVFSGCDDAGYSVDSVDSESKEVQGAMTSSFIDTFAFSKNSYELFLLSLRQQMVRYGFVQIPQMSSGRFLDLTTKFTF